MFSLAIIATVGVWFISVSIFYLAHVIKNL